MRMTAKGLLLGIVIICLVGGVTFAASEGLADWERIYREAANDEQRYTVMQKIIALKDKDFVPLMRRALVNLYGTKIDTASLTMRDPRFNLSRLLIRELANFNATEAAQTIFAIYKDSKVALIKADAAIALGKLQAVNYVEQLARDLADINLKPDVETAHDQEIVADGLVRALAAMKAAAGYEPVFLASVGWYSPQSKVRATAESVLVDMVNDPTDSLSKIIQENPRTDVKIQALTAAGESKAPAARKAAVARVALRIGLDQFKNDPTQARALEDLRKRAMKLLVDTNDHDNTSANLLQEVVMRYNQTDAVMDETIRAYTALGYNGSDTAANFLVDRLDFYNDRQRGMVNTPRDKRLIRELIAAMKRSKNPLVKPVLNRSQYVSDYDAQILRDIKDALKDF